MRRLAPLAWILLLCLLCGGLWLVLQEPRGESLPSEATGRSLLEAEDSARLAPGAAGDTSLAPGPGREVGESSSAELLPSETGVGSAQVQAVPEDPVDHGLATLALSVLDEETGAALSGTVILWRLDVPADDYWQAGDRSQGAMRIVAGEGEMNALPEGRYRAVFEEQRAAADDPALFEVRGGRTELTLRVPMPRRFQASLLLLDERGLPLRDAEVAWPRRRHKTLFLSPAWVRARTLKHPATSLPAPGKAQPSSIGDRSWQPLSATEELLPLGELEEASRGSIPGGFVAVRAEGRSEVRLIPFSVPTPSVTYLGVALPLATLLDRFVLPDGGAVLGSNARVMATCEAEPVTSETPPDRWRSMPIRIAVTLSGYEPIGVTADADHPSPLPPPWKRVEEKPPEAPR